MRQKRIKGVNKELLQSRGVVTEIKPLVLPDIMLDIEIGSGKGEFITSLAKDHQDIHYIALEKNQDVCYRILEKKEALELQNLTIILGDAIHLKTYLEHHLVSRLYLNFSDPWPKKKHHKRRLTEKAFIPIYLDILKDDGILQFRTDHESFFNDSIISLETAFDIIDIDRNLPVSDYMTEYEQKKRVCGPIYQLKGRKKTCYQNTIKNS